MTTKFNLSAIMTNAWAIVKQTKVTLSEALKAAWDLAKRATVATVAILNETNAIAMCEEALKAAGLRGNKWQNPNDGSVRLYINGLKSPAKAYAYFNVAKNIVTVITPSDSALAQITTAFKAANINFASYTK